EDVLAVLLARHALHVGDLLGLDEDLADEALAAQHLHDDGRLALGTEVPVQVVVVVEHRLRRAGAQDAVGVPREPGPERLEGEGGRLVHVDLREWGAILARVAARSYSPPRARRARLRRMAAQNAQASASSVPCPRAGSRATSGTRRSRAAT